MAPPKAAAVTAAVPADFEIGLTAGQMQMQLFKGQPTQVWSYQGKVLVGDPQSLQALPNSYLGPIIRTRKGQQLRVRFTNNMPDESIIHWHGLRVPDDMDGHPRYAIGPGETYDYEFPVVNRAGMYWYHPHPHGLTGPQVYGGLAGLFIVSDDEEAALGLPAGEFDVPMVIQDRTFDANNQLVYLSGGGGMGMGMNMDQMTLAPALRSGASAGVGFLGDRILVNGRPDFVLPVATRPYRLRFLNGSNSRIYKLGWSDGTPLTVIATDGGLLAKPVQRPYVMLAPAERIELWVDFSGRRVGSELTLQSLEFVGVDSDRMPGGSSGGMGGMGMMHGARALPNGVAFPIMKVRVERESKDRSALPARLSEIKPYRLEDAVNGKQPRSFGITVNMMNWLINGRQFEMEAVAPDEIVKLNTLEAWEFVNKINPGHMMEPMGMAHAMHLHAGQFQVLERQVLPELKAGWNSVKDGLVDEGWKDTVLLMPGERVKLLMKFEDYPGLFLYHCHNLEHEDSGMMRNFRIDA
ncbi:MAG: multicopper oxidase domain-containing protein [Anaerolineae bacterium]|nr:multicopper oxidase domain-containing protein [Anaerolineae bacterium]